MIKKLIAQSDNAESVMSDVHYTVIMNQPQVPKVFTQDEITCIVLGLDGPTDVKQAILRQILANKYLASINNFLVVALLYFHYFLYHGTNLDRTNIYKT